MWPSRAHAARSACSSRPAQHPSPRPDSAASPWPLVLLPRVGHAPWGREGSALHAVLVAFEGTRQLEASGATAVSRRGVPEERGGPFVTFPRCSGPVPAQQPRAGSPQGLSQLGQVPRFLLGALLPRSPPREGCGGLGAGPAGAAKRDEGRFLKLYFSAGSFRVNELTS